MPAKILIVEDHDDFRQMLKSHLEHRLSDVAVSEAETGEAGIEHVAAEHPQVVVMDIRLPGINGVDAANRIKAMDPKCEIVVLTMFETDNFRRIFKSKDVTIYIGKSHLYDTLIPAIQKILSLAGNNRAAGAS